MTFSIGSLVKARGREWVVLPESSGNLLILRPLGGTDEEITGIYMPIEKVEPAQFDLPNPTQVGDFRSSRLLRDAVRLSSRACAGPFRSFGRIAVEPRPYQLVPLLMALKIDPVRMLIADDVGIGKTIEALLIARELLDRGEIHRLAVLCPPHLTAQWQKQMYEKFHIETELVLSSTASRLERNCRVGQSLFDVYPYVIVSMDYIKSDRHRDEFVRACPEFIIIDEAHTCAFGYEGHGRHQRHQLITQLAAAPEHHLILVTATPHSGKEDAFRSLLKFLNKDFASLPEDLTGAHNEKYRRHLATHFVQRRRGDIQHFMDTDTPFPKREESESTYSLSPEYRRMFERVLNYCRETVANTGDGRQSRQRVRWWSALALLRSVGSSPAAAAATLRNRSPVDALENIDEIEEIGRRTVFDMETDDQTEGLDIIHGSSTDEQTDEAKRIRTRLLDMAREAAELYGSKDNKLLKAVDIVKQFLNDGFKPILFCRFIPTAEYVAQELRTRLHNDVSVVAITGTLPPQDRESRIVELAKAKKYVLVCTDCLSEGIDLQEHFDAVMHYDLSWSPTRHEQREGRVDRYGQATNKVRILTYYGQDNPIDGIVLEILIRKHNKIRTSLGYSVPVPVNTDSLMEAIFEGLMIREQETRADQLILEGFEEYMRPKKDTLHMAWDIATDREKRSRTMFAQETIKPDEVAKEFYESNNSIGASTDVEQFTVQTLQYHNAVVTKTDNHYNFNLSEIPRALKDVLGVGNQFKVNFELPVKENIEYVSRTHPFVENLAAYVMDSALDTLSSGIAKRCGAIRTNAVSRRTTLLIVRYRYYIEVIAKPTRNTDRTPSDRTPSDKNPSDRRDFLVPHDPQTDKRGFLTPHDTNSLDRRGFPTPHDANSPDKRGFLTPHDANSPDKRGFLTPHDSQLAEECRVLAFEGAPSSAQWLENSISEKLLYAEPDSNVYPEQTTVFVQKVLDGFNDIRQHLYDVAKERSEALLNSHQRVRAAARIKGVNYSVAPHLPPDIIGIFIYLPIGG